MTEEELDEIQQRADRATEGPWEYDLCDDRAKPGSVDQAFPLDGDETGGDVYRYVGENMLVDSIASFREYATTFDAETGSPVSDDRVSLRPNDAVFIAHARRDVCRLVEEVRRLKKLTRG